MLLGNYLGFPFEAVNLKRRIYFIKYKGWFIYFLIGWFLQKACILRIKQGVTYKQIYSPKVKNM